MTTLCEPTSIRPNQADFINLRDNHIPWSGLHPNHPVRINMEEMGMSKGTDGIVYAWKVDMNLTQWGNYNLLFKQRVGCSKYLSCRLPPKANQRYNMPAFGHRIGDHESQTLKCFVEKTGWTASCADTAGKVSATGLVAGSGKQFPLFEIPRSEFERLKKSRRMDMNPPLDKNIKEHLSKFFSNPHDKCFKGEKWRMSAESDTGANALKHFPWIYGLKCDPGPRLDCNRQIRCRDKTKEEGGVMLPEVYIIYPSFMLADADGRLRGHAVLRSASVSMECGHAVLVR